MDCHSDSETTLLREEREHLLARIAVLERQIPAAPAGPGQAGPRRLMEDALIDDEARFRYLGALLEHSSQPFATAYPDGRIGMANAAFCELVGYSLEELKHLTWSVDLTPPEWRARQFESLERLHRTGEPCRYEKEYIRKDGTRVPVEVAVHEVRNAGGDEDDYHYYAFITDLSTRKRADEAQASLQAIVDSTIDLIWSVDPVEFGLLAWNRGLQEYFLSHRGLVLSVGMRPQDLFLADAQDVIQMCGDLYARALSDGPFTQEYTVFDGTRVLELTLNRLELGGRIFGISVFGKDVTARRSADQSRQEAEEQYREIFEGAIEGIFRSYVNGRLLTANPAFAHILGYESVPELLTLVTDNAGQLWYDASDRPWAAAAIAEHGIIQHHECRFKRKDGSPVWVSLNVRIVRGADSSPLFYEGFIEDITGRKRIEEALRESEERYRNLIENATVGIYRTTPEGHIQMANQTLVRMLGYESFAELAARDLEQPGFEPEYPRAQFHNLLAEKGVVQGLEAAWTRLDGSTLFVRESARGVKDETGAVRFYEGIVEDITERRVAEEALRQSEEKFSTAFRLSPTASILVDFEDSGRVLDINDAFEQLSGYSRDEAVGRTRDELGYWADPLQREEVARRIRMRARLRNYEIRVRRKNGEIRTGLMSAERIELNGRECVIAAIIDITERKWADEQLRRNERTLRALVRTLQYRAETTQEFLDQALNEVTDLTASKVGYIFLYDEDRREFVLSATSKQVLDECLVDNSQTRYQLENTGLWGEAVRQRKPIILNDYLAGNPWKKGCPEGHVHPKRFMTLPVFSKDRIVAVVGVANKDSEYDETDVLQLTLLMDGVWKWLDAREAEGALRNSQQRLHAILDQTPALVCVKDMDGRLILTNRSFEQTFGQTGETLLGKTSHDFLPPSVADAHQANDLAVMQKGEAHSVHEDVDSPDGKHTFLSVKFPLLEASGTISGICAISTDITADLQAEAERDQLLEQLRQAQKMESIGRLAGGIAHDFNNLLTVINGYSQLSIHSLREGDPLAKSLQEIHKAGERAAQLTKQLLTFSRKQIVDPKRVDLNALITETRDMLRRLMGEDVEVAVQLEPRLGSILADPGNLHQILMNLAVNARDAMPHGGRFSIETANVDLEEEQACGLHGIEPGPFVRLSVSDTGIGMNEELRGRIFEPFFTTKAAGEGTGLGLSTVYGIVRQSAGCIEVQSEPGKGTAFVIHLPRIQRPEEPREKESASEPPLRGTETLLLVEDQAEVRKLAVMVLKRRGYKVLEAANGGEALLAAERHSGPIHLMITDVVMPGMTGKELAERLKPLRPAMKVLYMSGYTADIVTRRGLLESGELYIAKPFSPDALVAKVRQVLGPAQETATILVADEEAGVRDFFRQVLVGAGYRVLVANDLKEAPGIARSQSVQAILLGLAMPDREGAGSIQALRREVPGSSIIAVSGAFGGQFPNLAQRLGADAALSKPVSPDLLLARVAEVLARPR